MMERSEEEIADVIAIFRDVFEDQMGTPITDDQLRNIIKEILSEREKQLIKLRFMDFSPRNLRQVLDKVAPDGTYTVQDLDSFEQASEVASKVRRSKRSKNKDL